MRNILVTGCAGFIGSNFLSYFLDKYPKYKIIGLDALTYAGDFGNIDKKILNSDFHFVKGDICNRELVDYLFSEFKVTDVIHFAAESHVDNSIKNANIFIKTNIEGTYTLLDVAKNHWIDNMSQHETRSATFRFHHISTDEVYGSLDETGLFTEATPYAPNSPYSASKASSDMLVRSYHHTYGLNTVITNCSNNYGPKQHDEKLIPTIIRNALAGHIIPIYGDGQNIRDWLYVTDHCSGIDVVFHDGNAGETYNIGGDNEKTNLEVLQTICNILDDKLPKDKNYIDLLRFVEDRAGHDRRYAIDATKIKNKLGWQVKEDFNSGIAKTVDWYLYLDRKNTL